MKLAKIESVYRQNLLINGDFQINQRGKNLYSSENFNKNYTIDKWYLSGTNAKLNVNDGSITIVNDSTTPAYFANVINRDGEHTIQIYVNKINTGSAKFYFTGQSNGYQLNQGMNVFHSNQPFTECSFELQPNTSIEVKYAYLVSGSIAYQYIQEDYATALMRCQQYVYSVTNGNTYCYIGNGSVFESGLTRIFVDIPITMASIPTLEMTGQFELINSKDDSFIVNSASINANFCSSNKIAIQINPTTGFSAGDYLILRTNNNSSASFILSCEP